MITGHVIAGQYATLPLVLQGRHGPEDPLNAIIDTGFTGFLTLPLPRIADAPRHARLHSLSQNDMLVL